MCINLTSSLDVILIWFVMFLSFTVLQQLIKTTNEVNRANSIKYEVLSFNSIFLNMMSNKISCLIFCLSLIFYVWKNMIYSWRNFCPWKLWTDVWKKYYQKMTVSAQIDNQSSWLWCCISKGLHIFQMNYISLFHIKVMCLIYLKILIER